MIIISTASIEINKIIMNPILIKLNNMLSNIGSMINNKFDGNRIFPADSTWESSKEVPDYQAIDESKLVPLLVKTIQELEARVKTLENK